MIFYLDPAQNDAVLTSRCIHFPFPFLSFSVTGRFALTLSLNKKQSAHIVTSQARHFAQGLSEKSMNYSTPQNEGYNIPLFPLCPMAESGADK